MRSFREHLQETFMSRLENNRQYSMRAFAKSLAVPPTTLSEILSGKRAVSIKMRNKIGLALGMSPEDIQEFEGKEHGNSKNLEYKITQEDNDYQQLELDNFYIISQWYHYGILQLMRTSDFKEDRQFISKRLGITTTEVDLAIERLLRVGILKREVDGKLTDNSEGHTTHLKPGYTNKALRDYQKNALQRASQKVQEVSIHHRDNTSMTMAINKQAMDFAKNEITKFRRELCQKLESFGEADEVYELLISLTPLTEIQEKSQ